VAMGKQHGVVQISEYQQCDASGRRIHTP
jgi:hypothetical protein